MELKTQQQTKEDAMDVIDFLCLLAEQMKELNGVISDICCHTCSLEEGASADLRANAYFLISRQQRLAIMSAMLQDRIFDMDEKINDLYKLFIDDSSEVMS